MQGHVYVYWLTLEYLVAHQTSSTRPDPGSRPRRLKKIESGDRKNEISFVIERVCLCKPTTTTTTTTTAKRREVSDNLCSHFRSLVRSFIRFQ